MTTAGRTRSAAERPQTGTAARPSALSTQHTAVILAALASGGLLWLCHFPVAWGWLGWVALMPLLCLVRADVSQRLVLLGAWACGLAFFVPVLQWMRVADYRMYATWAMLAVYCSLYFPLGVWMVRRLDRTTRLPLVLTLPLVWVALDFLRAHFVGGFAWYFLGHTQHNFLPVIQVADLGGVYAVTLLVAAVNAVVFEWLSAMPSFRARFALAEPSWSGLRPLVMQTAAVALLLGATLGYGYWRLAQDDFAPGPRVALLQGNVPQSVRNDASGPNGESAADWMVKHYSELCDVAALQKPMPDLIIWPETCFSFDWVETADGEPADSSREWMGFVNKRWRTNVLLGLNAQAPGPDGRSRRYNSSVLIRSDGQPAGRYDKMHLVPFGEYVPPLPGMSAFAPYDFDYSVTPGEQHTRFALGPHRFGMVICYEDTDPDLARQYARPGADGSPPVNFLVNTSNDGWFDGTSEHEEHLAVARFRAVECRRSLVRAVNMGISAVIDPNGHVLEPASEQRYEVLDPEAPGRVVTIPRWQVASAKDAGAELPLARWAEFKKTHGVLVADIPIDRRSSLYAAWGDWLPWACWAAVALGLLSPALPLLRRTRE